MQRHLGVWIGLLCWLFLATPQASAQELLDLLQDKSEKGGKADLPSPEEIKQRLKKLDQQIDKDKKTDRNKQFREHKKELDKQQLRYQTRPKEWRIRSDKEIMTLRADIAKELRRNIAVINQLQTVHSTVEQTRIDLKESYKRYLAARQTIEKLIQKNFDIKTRGKLKRVMKKLRRKQKKQESQLKRIDITLKKLASASAVNKQAIEIARRQMMKEPKIERRPPPPPKRVEPKPEPRRRGRRRRRRRRRQATPPPPPRPSAAELKRKERERERKQLLEQLQSTKQRTHFTFLRDKDKLYKLRQENSELSQQNTQAKIQLYTYVLGEMESAYQLLSAQAEGGLLHHQPFHFNIGLLHKISDHSNKRWREWPKEMFDTLDKIDDELKAYQERSGLSGLLLAILSPFLLLFLAFFLRLGFRRILAWLDKRSHTSSSLQKLWRTIYFFTKIFADVLPNLAFLFATVLTLRVIHLPATWRLVLLTLLGMLALVRGIFSAANQLLDPDPEERILHKLKDETAQKARRFLKTISAFTLLYFPCVRIVKMQGFPHEIVDILYMFFFATLLFGLLYSFVRNGGIRRVWRVDPKLSFFERVVVHRLYPVFLLCGLGVFFVYARGYHNLSIFLIEALLFSALIVGCAYALFQFLTMQLLWIFGFSQKRKALFQLEQKFAQRLLRMVRLVIGILIAFLALGFLFEAWRVPGGLKFAFGLLNKPFLTVQKTKLSFMSFIKFFLVFGTALWLSRFLKKQLDRYVYKLLSLESGTRHAADTVVGYIVMALGLLLGLQAMGIGVGVLAVFAGVIGIGVGFGLQNIANNFISGLLITFGRPISVNDVIEVGGVTGIVRSISARSTTIETIERRVILIPNSDIITSQVINWSLGAPYVLISMDIGVGYSSDVELVERTLLQIGQAHPSVLQEPAPFIRFLSFGASSLDFQLNVAVTNPMARGKILSELRFETNYRFNELDIEISFPQQDIHFDAPVQSAFEALASHFSGNVQPGPQQPSSPIKKPLLQQVQDSIRPPSTPNFGDSPSTTELSIDVDEYTARRTLAMQQQEAQRRLERQQSDNSLELDSAPGLGSDDQLSESLETKKLELSLDQASAQRMQRRASGGTGLEGDEVPIIEEESEEEETESTQEFVEEMLGSTEAAEATEAAKSDEEGDEEGEHEEKDDDAAASRQEKDDVLAEAEALAALVTEAGQVAGEVKAQVTSDHPPQSSSVFAKETPKEKNTEALEPPSDLFDQSKVATPEKAQKATPVSVQPPQSLFDEDKQEEGKKAANNLDDLLDLNSSGSFDDLFSNLKDAKKKTDSDKK